MARKFEIGGLPYELLDLDDFDFDQGKQFKDLSGGMGIFDAQEGFNRGDMDVWRALLLMSIQVKNPAFTMADLGKQKIAGVLLSLMQQMQDELDRAKAKEAGAGPPAVAPARSRRGASRSSSAGAATRDAPGVPA